MGRDTFVGMPKIARSLYSQPYSLRDRSDAASGYQSAEATVSSTRDNFVHFLAFTLSVTSDLSTCAGARRRRARRPSTRRCRPGTRAVT